MHELYLIEQKLRGAVKFANGRAPIEQYQTYSGMVARTKIPLLERFVDKFGEFDSPIATSLSNALSVVLQMKMNEPLPGRISLRRSCQKV